MMPFPRMSARHEVKPLKGTAARLVCYSAGGATYSVCYMNSGAEDCYMNRGTMGAGTLAARVEPCASAIGLPPPVH